MKCKSISMGFGVMVLLAACRDGAPADGARKQAAPEPGPTPTAAKPQVSAAPAVAPGEPLMPEGKPVVFTFKPEVYKDAETPSGFPPKLRIATYNIQDFVDGEKDPKTPDEARRQAKNAAAAVGEADPDVVVLQEIENAEALSLLNDAMAKKFPFGAITRFRAGQYGRNARTLNVAALSRYPILNPTRIDLDAGLTGTNKPPRGLMRFEIALAENHHLLVYTMHLKSNYGDDRNPSVKPDNRAKRYNALKYLVQDIADYTVSKAGVTWEIVAAGDMNTDPESRQFEGDISLLPLKGWVDLWVESKKPREQEWTIHKRSNDVESVSFDRFVVSPALKDPPWLVTKLPEVIRRGVVDLGKGDKEEDYASDHFPVFIDLAPAAAAP